MTRDAAPYWIIPKALFNDGKLVTGWGVLVDQGEIKQVELESRIADQKKVFLDKILAPGYIDLQVNGGGDVLFNTDPTPDGICKIAKAHRQFGTVAILPTVITDAPDVLERAAQAILDLGPHPDVLGIHIEGPHISKTRRGTHNPNFIRSFDTTTLRLIERLRAADVFVKITLAPEKISIQDIRKLAEMEVLVSLGHTNATFEETQVALDAGASCFTHLFNAMPPIINRNPGVTVAALNSDAYAGLICDGHHVSDEVLKMALRAHRRNDRMFIVSDSMPTIGGQSSFELYGSKVNVINGKLINSDGNLAGAHITQARGVVRLIGALEQPLERALAMAIAIPADAVSRPDLKRINERKLEDCIMLSETGEISYLSQELKDNDAGISAIGPE